MPRTMYDSTRAKNIPADAGMVAGYVDEYTIPKWTQAEWDRFPHAVKVRIAKKASTNDGHVLDVEDRLATPEEAPGWARMRRRAGLAYPTIYCNRSTWALVRAEFDRQGELQPLYFIATASGKAEIPDGAIAAQYLLDTAENTDISVVADYWPGVDPAPVPAPTPGFDNHEERSMLIPAGTNEHFVLPCAGPVPQWFYIYAAYGHKVRMHQIDFVMATPTGTGDPEFVPGAGLKDWTFDPNRPGPVEIPKHPDGRQPVGVVFRYTADHPFTAYTG